jgi:peptide/nickel transport system substrate-binding protein
VSGGFDVDFQEYAWHRWLSDVFQKKDYDLTLIAHVEPMDMNIYARDDYYFNYENTAFKTLWQNVLNARTEDELNPLLKEAQELIAEDAVKDPVCHCDIASRS